MPGGGSVIKDKKYLAFEIDKDALQNVDKLLANVEIEFRSKIADKALRAVGNVVAKEAGRLAPRGDPRHNPTKEPLNKQIRVRIWRPNSNSPITTAVVGQRWPQGAHAHLVEGYKQPHRIVISRGPNKGKDTGLRAVAKPFMAPAVDATAPQQAAAFFETTKKEIDKVLNKNKKNG